MKKKWLNLESDTRTILGIVAVILVAFYVIGLWGKGTILNWIAVISGFLVFLVLFFEGAFMDYFRRKAYKSIGFSDIITWISMVVAVTILVNTIGLISYVSAVEIPQLFVNIGVPAGIIGGLLALYYMFTPKPKM